MPRFSRVESRVAGTTESRTTEFAVCAVLLALVGACLVGIAREGIWDRAK